MTAHATEHDAPQFVADPPDDRHDSSVLAAAALLLARRFSSGATLWCIAPGRDDHARHVAVEFVHPVIVGSPTLPSAAITGADIVAEARALVRSGDVVLLIGESACSPLAELAARAQAWGAALVWFCLHDQPPVGAADVAVRCKNEADLVRAYHLVWELCHVCLQHPDVLTGPSSQQLTAPDCAVCSDEAVTAEVSGLARDGMVRVRTACGQIDAADLVGDLRVGDLVLTHAATVIGRRI